LLSTEMVAVSPGAGPVQTAPVPEAKPDRTDSARTAWAMDSSSNSTRPSVRETIAEKGVTVAAVVSSRTFTQSARFSSGDCTDVHSAPPQSRFLASNSG